MNSQEKIQAVETLNARFSESIAAFVVNYKGCSCEQLTSLRKELQPSGAKFAVVKNTLAKRAITDTPAESLDEVFVGPTAVVWSKEDPVTPAKVLSKFSEEQESFEIKAGVVEGSLVDTKGIEALASMPSKEELYAKLLSLINAPATRLLQTINAPSTELVRLLAAWKQKLEDES